MFPMLYWQIISTISQVGLSRMFVLSLYVKWVIKNLWLSTLFFVFGVSSLSTLAVVCIIFLNKFNRWSQMFDSISPELSLTMIHSKQFMPTLGGCVKMAKLPLMRIEHQSNQISATCILLIFHVDTYLKDYRIFRQ